MIDLLEKKESIKIKLLTTPVAQPVICISISNDIQGETLKTTLKLNDTEKKVLISNPPLNKRREIEKIHIHNDSDEEIEFILYHCIDTVDTAIFQEKVQTKKSITYLKNLGWPQTNLAITTPTIIAPWSKQEFITSGTWTKPNNLKWLQVICIGAGGGAGSGRRGPNGANRFGGGGGGGGAITTKLIQAEILPSSIDYIIGTGGIGGAAIEVNNTNGNNGTVGGDTSFGGIVIAKGGNPGLGGTGAAGTGGTGGQTNACIPSFSPFSLIGAGGGAGTSANGTNGSLGMAGNTACPSGGGGGGVSSVNAYGVTGGNGGGVYNLGTLVTGPISNSGIRDGLNNQCTFILQSTEMSTIKGIGTAGAGGYGNGAFINGGDAGNYGCGGGGGGGSIDGLASGKGGDGGDGLLILFEFYN